MIDPDHARQLATSKVWANERLLTTCAALHTGELARPRSAACGSSLATRNHPVVGDRIWLARIAAAIPPELALDAIVHQAPVGLAEQRRARDVRIAAIAGRVDRVVLAADIRCRPVSAPGVGQRAALGRIRAHMAKHGTHHRGQMHGVLAQTSGAHQPLDLIMY